MQSLVFLACFYQKLTRKTFGVRLDPLGKGRVKYECFFCELQIADVNLFTELIL